MSHEMVPEIEQAGFDFDKEGVIVAGALCFDERRPHGKEVVRLDLTSIGDGKYIDAEGWIYERAVNRAVDGPEPRFSGGKERYDRRPNEL